ncbi:hypothetical protein [Myceligenerans indicum]|uniref:Uncharacterized protein n=1 Tax=Myceligenerans indicum TaxID=2593663 RepID=A0ABS1LLG8_9MICO|nr:hypothetical protein [Myceligenerans indicum]MBL0887077.1 hypothetical protein [Myceligenerans indicum]
MRRTAAVVALVAALSLTGCSTPTGADVTGREGAAAESPAGPLTPAAAGEQFLRIVAPYNGVLEQFETSVNDGAPLAEQTGLAGAVGAALRAESEGLRQTAWPEDVADDATALAEANEQAASHWEQAASAQSTQEVLDHVDQAMEADAGDAAASIREKLDLPAYAEE